MLELLANWNIKNASLERIKTSAGKVWLVTGGLREQYILKMQHEHLLKAEHKTLFCLKEQNIPVASPLLTVDRQYYAIWKSGLYCLYPLLPGTAITEHFSDGAERRARLFGKAVAELHRGLRNCRNYAYPVEDIGARVRDWAGPLLQFAAGYLPIRRINKVIDCFLEKYSPLSGSLPVQLTHGDMHPGNMLFQDETVTGYLDFEIVAYRVRIYDPTYCAAGLLLLDFKNESKRARWFSLLVELIKGYNSRIKLTRYELGSIFPILLAALIFMIAFYCNDGAPKIASYLETILFWIYQNEKKIKGHLSSGIIL